MGVDCFQCGAEINEGDGTRHRGRAFCSDECCEEFEEEFATTSEPIADELLDDNLDIDGLDFSDEDIAEGDPLDDDIEYQIDEY